MTLDDLKSFIVATRRQEGVNWYIRSQRPVGAVPDSCTLLAFDNAGNLVGEVTDLEDATDGRLPADRVKRISDLRQHVGMNANYARNYKSSDGGSAQLHFEKCLIAWQRASPSGALMPLGPAR